MSSYDKGYALGQAMAPLIFFLLLGLAFYFLYWRKRKKKGNDNTLDQI